MAGARTHSEHAAPGRGSPEFQGRGASHPYPVKQEITHRRCVRFRSCRLPRTFTYELGDPPGTSAGGPLGTRRSPEGAQDSQSAEVILPARAQDSAPRRAQGGSAPRCLGGPRAWADSKTSPTSWCRAAALSLSIGEASPATRLLGHPGQRVGGDARVSGPAPRSALLPRFSLPGCTCAFAPRVGAESCSGGHLPCVPLAVHRGEGSPVIPSRGKGWPSPISFWWFLQSPHSQGQREGGQVQREGPGAGPGVEESLEGGAQRLGHSGGRLAGRSRRTRSRAAAPAEGSRAGLTAALAWRRQRVSNGSRRAVSPIWASPCFCYDFFVSFRVLIAPVE